MPGPADSAQILPPCTSIILRASASPMPVPDAPGSSFSKLGLMTPVYPYAVVAHENCRLPSELLDAHFHHGGGLRPHKLHGVVQQVLEVQGRFTEPLLGQPLGGDVVYGGDEVFRFAGGVALQSGADLGPDHAPGLVTEPLFELCGGACSVKQGAGDSFGIAYIIVVGDYERAA